MSSMVWDPLAGRYKPGPEAPRVGIDTVGAAPRYPTTGMPTAGTGGDDPYQQAWSVISPQLQAAADAINRRSQIGSGQITDLTNIYSQRMSAASGMDVFGPEKKYLRGAADWGQSSLVGSGQQQQASLGAAARQAGFAPSAAGRDLNLQQQGKGAGAAAYGTGISWLDAQVAKATAAATRSALEPSFAAGMGQMQQGILANNLQRQLADQQSQIQAQIPQLLLDLTQRQQDVAYRNQQAAESKREWEISRQDQINANKSKTVGPNAPTLQGRMAYWQAIAENRTKHDPRGWVYEGTYTGIHPVKDAKTGQPIVDPGFAAAQAQGLIPKSVKVTPGGTVGHYTKDGAFVTDYTAPNKPPTQSNLAYKNVLGGDGKVHVVGLNPKTGKQVIDVGLAPPGSKAGGTVKMPTPGQTTGFVKGWYTGSQPTQKQQVGTDSNDNPVYKDVPATDKKGNPIYQGQIGYQEGYKKLRAMGYDDVRARSYLDTYYKRGERGRPWLSTTQRAALKKVGLSDVARYHEEGGKQYGYIGAKQYAALKKLGMAPPADLRNGLYWIRPGTA